MAEIKSAIELAMEKTRGLVMDDKEKKSLALKESADGFKVIFRRFREGLADDEETRGQLDALECDPALKRKIVLDLLVEEFESTDDPGIGPLFAFVGFVVDEKSYKELKLIEKACVEELKKIGAGIRSHIAEDLASSGIAGNSVEPNVEAWPRWQEAHADVRRAFRQQIGQWKERLLQEKQGHS